MISAIAAMMTARASSLPPLGGVGCEQNCIQRLHRHCTGTTLVMHLQCTSIRYWYCAGAALVLRWHCAATALDLVLQRCCISTGLLQWCTSHVLVPRRPHMGTGLLLHWCHTGDALRLREYCTGAARELLGQCTGIASVHWYCTDAVLVIGWHSCCTATALVLFVHVLCCYSHGMMPALY